jgi:hypothetical protein
MYYEFENVKELDLQIISDKRIQMAMLVSSENIANNNKEVYKYSLFPNSRTIEAPIIGEKADICARRPPVPNFQNLTKFKITKLGFLENTKNIC